MTNNADMPAMPVVRERDTEMFGEVPSGLTKREYFAGLAMQAMITNPHWTTNDSISDDAVYAADSLLAKLERTK